MQQQLTATWWLQCASSPQALAAGQRLREQVFAEELAWVPRSSTGLECDAYDPGSVHVCVGQGTELAGYVRLTPRTQAWMLDGPFAELWPGSVRQIVPAASLEVSRLAVRHDLRGRACVAGRSVFDALLYGMSRYSQAQQAGPWYAVVAVQVYHWLMAKGLACQALSAPQRMPDGVQALVVRIAVPQLSWPQPLVQAAIIP
ncbi:GNAT family N-acyltransferase [Atopomonas hussainii]|uniref:GNAT family N-acyltransferase n=1 Tax=Atopomonas hussainii TaxID=1429083 RepID=UPI0009003260|nr:GNAT family N-acyltransferase [Atopomonas hussainii]